MAGLTLIPKILDYSHQLLTNGMLLSTNGFSEQFHPAIVSESEGLGPEVELPSLRVQPILTSGPSENRVDLVFFSDGYIEDEYEKFIADATRLAYDVSNNQTFNTVKPLLNFWAAFTPSKEHGIGVGGKPLDTPFGLYRDGTELRGVYYSKPEVARASCISMGTQCDYPILLGNDPFYGGLGGEFTVITSSFANGPLVLRHELGHSIIDVGEEYDGGTEYFGVNAAHELESPLPWSQWLSNSTSDSSLHVERSIVALQEYPWSLLNSSSPWSIKFTSSGTYFRHLLRFSLSGIPEADDLKVELDGVDVDWKPQQDIGIDRWHYDFYRNGTLTDGEHEIKFTLKNKDREGTAQLCSVEILEFGDDNEFASTPGYYGVFPTFSDTNTTTYRPTNEDCLMRAITKPNFCKVCKEGLWLSLLRRVAFVDEIVGICRWEVTANAEQMTGVGGRWKKTLDARLVPLAHLRDHPVDFAESYTITWTKDGKALEDFTNKTRLEVDGLQAIGTYKVTVNYETEEVRVDREGLLTSDEAFIVTENCQ